jgi:hypothetical protein
MMNVVARRWAVVLACGLSVFSVGAQARAGSQAAEVLTNDAIVQMVVGKVPRNVILTKIQSTKSEFDIAGHELVSLYQKKVAKDTILAMIQAVAPSAPKELLTNEEVIYMLTNALPRDIVIAKIQASKPGFDLTATGLVNLNQNKVAQDVMKAMMAATPPASSSAPAAPTPAPSGQAPKK